MAVQLSATPVQLTAHPCPSLFRPPLLSAGGVIVCCDNFVLYRNTDAPELRAVIPRRADLPPDRGVLITAAATLRHKQTFFLFVQSEYGDIYRITLAHEGETVTELKIRYFDSIPPANALCVLRRGFLFAASEFGDHALYQLTGVGDDEDAVESSSATLERVAPERPAPMAVDGAEGGNEEEEEEEEEGYVPVFFEPRFPHSNLELLDRVESLAPILDMKVANLLGEEIPQIYTACGRGPRSSLRVLRPGLAVSEMAVSPLPSTATGVWTVRRSAVEEHDAYIVVSFAAATLVLGVGETVEQVTDSGFALNGPTLRVQLLADDSMLQVHPQGLRHIRPDRRVNEWRAPGRRAVVHAATNARQVVIALSGGELIYFELSAQGMLVEVEKRDIGGDVAALDVAPVPEGLQRSKFLAVGAYDSTVRLLSLDPADTLRTLSTQALGATPESVLVLDSPGGGSSGSGGGAADEAVGAGGGALYLQVGLSNGVLLRTEVDRVTGQLTDTRTRFLGVKGPKLAAVAVRGQRAALALSSRPWLGYWDQGRFNQVPISYEALDFAAPFCSEQVPEGIVGVARNTLRVIAVDRLGQFFNQQTLRLRYTPRRLAIHPDHSVLVVVEADAQTVPWRQRQQAAAAAAEQGGEGAEAAAAEGAAEVPLDVAGPEGDEALAAREEALGPPRGAPGQWASCIRVVDPSSLESTHCVELDNNEAALCLCLAPFEADPTAGSLLCVGTAKGLQFNPRSAEGGFVRVYRLSPNGRSLEFVHSTDVGGVPRAMVAFKGRLLVGVGGALRLYDLGKKRLLRKCEYRGLPTEVASLHVSGSRVFVGDAQESFLFLK